MKPADCNQRPGAHYRRYLSLAPIVLALTACGGGALTRPTPPQTPPSAVTSPVPSTHANEVLMRAISLVGTPYRYGGNTPEGGFDCSGLVGYVFRDMLQMQLPRTTRELAALQGPRIAQETLNSGDLVFFASNGTVTHVGIYVGEGRFVHAPSTGGTVRLDRLDAPWWKSRYSGARRLLF